MPGDFQSTYLQANGIQIHVVEAGPGEGELVILLHGFPEFWRGWAKQIMPLAEAGFRVVVPDQRGYNHSEKPPGIEAYRIEHLAKDILGILAAYERSQAIIVGHDWGAAVAWHLAIFHAEAVKKLVILNVPHPTVMKRHLRNNLKQLLKSWYIFFFQVPGLPEWVMSQNNYAAMRKMLLTSSSPGVFTNQDLAAYVEAWRQPGALKAMLNWYRAIFRSEIRDPGQASSAQEVRVRVPVLVIWGAKDIALSSELVQPSLALCDDAKLVYYEDATHWVQHDKPSQVTQDMIAFIRQPSKMPG